MGSDLVFVVVVGVIGLWGAYKCWNALTGRSEWLDQKAPVSYIVKGAICLVLGVFYAIWKLINLALKLMSAFF